MWKRNFRSRRLSKTNNCKLANRRLKRRSKHDPPLAKRVRASPCISRCVLCCKMQHFAHRLSLKNAFGARLPSKSEIWRCEIEAFARKVTIEDVKRKLSCGSSVKNWKLKLWFRPRLPSKTELWRCQNDAFVRFLKANNFNVGKSLPEAAVTLRDLSEHDPPLEPNVSGICRPCAVKHKISRIGYLSKTHLVRDCLKSESCQMWNRNFCARLPLKSETWGCENETVVRGVPQKQKVDDIHCNDMDCSDIRCSDTHCRDIFGSDSSDTHGSDFQRSVTRKYRLPIFLCLCHVFRSISWPQKAEGLLNLLC